MLDAASCTKLTAVGLYSGEAALYAPYIAAALGTLGFLASLPSRNEKLGDAIIAATFATLVAVSTLDENTFLAAYICSVVLLALRDFLWLYSSGKTAGPLMHRVALVYGAALLVAVPSLVVRDLLPKALSPVIALVAVAALLLYLFTVAEKLRRDSYSSSTPR